MLRQRVSELFQAWKGLNVKEDGDCCGNDHFWLDNYGIWRFHKDEQVCVKELAWRKYVRLRDRNENYPFDRCGKVNGL